MRQGSIYRRCTRDGCRARVETGARKCPKCGGDRLSWSFVVDQSLPGGPRKQHKEGGFSTKAEAAERMARFQTEVMDGNHVERRKLTLGEYLDQWLASGTLKGWSANGMAAYRNAIENHIKPELGWVPLQAVTKERLKAFLGRCLAEGKRSRKKGSTARSALSRKSVNNIYQTIRAALYDAVNADPPLLKRNPVIGAYDYSWDSERPEMLTWTVEEMQTFLASVAADRDYPLYALLLNTGLRRGEALGLRRQDLHLDRREPSIDIRQQWAKEGASGASFRSLKGKARHWRSIELDPDTADMLRTHLEAQGFERRRDDYQDHGLVFCAPDGTPYDPDVTSRRFNAQVARCGEVKAIRLHDCRHTHATLLLEAGEAIDYVADRLGDRLDTVARVYAHVTRGRRVGAIARWAALKAQAVADRDRFQDSVTRL